VLIADQRDPSQQNTIFAETGELVSDPDRHVVTLRLEDGLIYTRDESGRSEYRTEFEHYTVNLDLQAALAGLSEEDEDPKELTLPALNARIAKNRSQGVPVTRELAEYHRKFRHPLRLRGVRPPRPAARHPAGTCRQVARLHRLGGGHLRVLHSLVGRQALAQQDRIPARSDSGCRTSCWASSASSSSIARRASAPCCPRCRWVACEGSCALDARPGRRFAA
jgi:hypothetical protein